MSFFFILGALTLFSAVCAGASGRLQHSVTLVGHNITFDCITKVPAAQMLWVHKSADATHSSKIVDGLSVKDNRSGRVRVDQSTSGINGSRLFIDNIQLMDAGTYSCINGRSNETQLAAELTVLAAEPTCATAMTYKTSYLLGGLKLRCQVNYSGTEQPFIHCRELSTNISPSPATPVHAGNSSHHSTSFTYNIDVDRLTKETRVECTTSVNMKDFPHGHVQYTWRWSSNITDEQNRVETQSGSSRPVSTTTSPGEVSSSPTTNHAGASGRLQHAVALVGHATAFDCFTKVPASQILWVHTSADRTHSSRLIDGLSVKDNRSGRILVVRSPADIDGSRLFIDNIQLMDAGTYSCINGRSNETQLTAELTVVACYTSIINYNHQYFVEESDNVFVTCNISNYGILGPSVTCDSDATHTRLVSAGFTTDHKSFRCYRWNVRATTAMHGSHIECSVWFEYQQEKIYNSVWISPAISVAYGPRSATIHPQNQTEFEEGDQLQCTSEGYPQPDYHWTVGKLVLTGQTLIVDVCKLNLTHGDSPSVPILLKCIVNRDDYTVTTTKEIRVNCSDTSDWHRPIDNQQRGGDSSQLSAVSVTAIVFLVLVAALGGVRHLLAKQIITITGPRRRDTCIAS